MTPEHALNWLWRLALMIIIGLCLIFLDSNNEELAKIDGNLAAQTDMMVKEEAEVRAANEAAAAKPEPESFQQKQPKVPF